MSADKKLDEKWPVGDGKKDVQSPVNGIVMPV